MYAWVVALRIGWCCEGIGASFDEAASMRGDWGEATCASDVWGRPSLGDTNGGGDCAGSVLFAIVAVVEAFETVATTGFGVADVAGFATAIDGDGVPCFAPPLLAVVDNGFVTDEGWDGGETNAPFGACVEDVEILFSDFFAGATAFACAGAAGGTLAPVTGAFTAGGVMVVAVALLSLADIESAGTFFVTSLFVVAAGGAPPALAVPLFAESGDVTSMSPSFRSVCGIGGGLVSRSSSSSSSRSKDSTSSNVVSSCVALLFAGSAWFVLPCGGCGAEICFDWRLIAGNAASNAPRDFFASAMVTVGNALEELTGGAVERPELGGGGCNGCWCCCCGALKLDADGADFDAVCCLESFRPDAAFFAFDGAVEGGGATAIVTHSSCGFDSVPPISEKELLRLSSTEVVDHYTGRGGSLHLFLHAVRQP
jgi:hypothetical protein